MEIPESRAQLLNSCQEEDLVSTIGFAHEVPQCRTRFHIGGDISHDRQMDSVVNEFLDEVAGHASSQTKKVVAQPRDGYHDPRNALLECPCNHGRCITAVLQPWTFCCTFQNVDATQFIRSVGHSRQATRLPAAAGAEGGRRWR